MSGGGLRSSATSGRPAAGDRTGAPLQRVLQLLEAGHQQVVGQGGERGRAGAAA